MIELGIIDLSADGRRRIAALIEKWAWVSPDSRVSVPRVSIALLSPEEVRFNGSLDVCVIGPELIGCDAAYVHTIRQQLSGKLILCVLTQEIYSFGLVEQLGRLGVDDVLLDTSSSEEFFRRLVLLQRRLTPKQRGRLVVVGAARGGVGCTFISATLAEGYLATGKRTCVVDCDVISQDLTRFLQVKPHVSEAVRMLLDHQRVVTSETVAECCAPVWSDEPSLVCVPPAAGQDESIFATPRAARALIALLEVLQSQYDVVVVDTASLPALTASSLYQVCDEVIFVVNRDPAGAFAHRQGVLLVSGCARPDATITVVVNDNSVAAAPLAPLRRDALAVPGRATRLIAIPRTPKASRWACSGATPYQFLGRIVEQLLESHSYGEGSAQVQGVVQQSRWWSAALARIVASLSKIRPRKGGGNSAESENPTAHEPLRFAALGFTECSLGEGELVSKPVILA